MLHVRHIHLLRCLLAAPFLFTSTAPVLATPLGAGDNMETVLALLGEPHAAILSSAREVWFYEQGKVVLEEGYVVSTDLLSEQEAEARRIRHEHAEAEREKQRREAALSLKQAKLADPFFRSAPAEQQVAYWHRFKREYPDVPVHAEYTLALQEMLREQTVALKAARENRRVEELEERVRAAEARTRAMAYDPPAQATTVHVIVNPPPAPQPVVVVQERIPEPFYYGVPHHRPVGHGLVRNRMARHAGTASGIHLGTRGVERTGPLGKSRVGQASTVFRPPLPRPPLVPSAFSPL